MKLTMTPDGYLTATAQTAAENQQLLTMKVDKDTERIRIDIQRDVQSPPKTVSEVTSKPRPKKYKSHIKMKKCKYCNEKFKKPAVHAMHKHQLEVALDKRAEERQQSLLS